MSGIKSTIRSRFTENMRRVETLLEVYRDRSPKGSGRRAVTDADLLRAAVVFLHATLEDILRSVAGWKLPTAESEVLSAIPLVGTGRRPKAFLLGELAGHRAKTVQKLIEESIAEHLELMTYNDTSEIARLLEEIGLDPSTLNGRFVDLQALMTRRHDIVHRADASSKSGRGHFSARSIGTADVERWIHAVRDFGTNLLRAL